MGRKKPSEFRSDNFLEEKNPQNSIQNISWQRKTLGIPFQTIFGRENLLNFVPNQFYVTENTKKSIQNDIWEQKTI
jgi:hypothetical protein